MELSDFIQEQVESQKAALRRLDTRPLEQLLAERRMPRPLWAERGYDETGTSAEETVVRAASASKNPFCIYIHIPYCVTKCGYCDCYAFPLINDERQQELSGYPDLICREIQRWAEASPEICQRKLTTVHFGGGTPLTAGTDGLRRIIHTLRQHFRLDADCELALESTGSALNEKVLDELQEIGFTRLHIGIQSLEDDVRRAIGRHESGKEVLEKLRAAVRRGWIVSTDIIIGLPQYHIEGIYRDIQTMHDAGAEGFSVYELVRSPRNRGFFIHHGIEDPDLVQMYTEYQSAFALLESLGYKRNIYNHMVRGRDDNRYFSSPQRNEDLLSFGAIADGSFGNCLYCHQPLPQYREDVLNGRLGLEGVILRNEREQQSYKLETQLRSGHPDPEIFVQIMGYEPALELFTHWAAGGMLKISQDECELTANGSWFISRLITDMRERILSSLTNVFFKTAPDKEYPLF